MLRSLTVLLPALLLTSTSLPAFAQAEDAVHERIEAIHGDADGFFELFSGLQDTLMSEEPEAIAQYALYPITVNANGETYDVLEEQDFIDNFDMLVSADTQEALLNQDVDDLIVTSEGIGLGNGALWITNTCLDESCAQTQWGILSINN